MKRLEVLACLTIVVLLGAVGCAPEQPPAAPTPPASPPPTAAASVVVELAPLGDSTASGEATFSREDGAVALEITLRGASPGLHAVHLHQVGDCSAPDGSSAGGHWNPGAAQHGQWGHDPFHLGDVGNVEVGADATGTLRMVSDKWTIGSGEPSDILGKSVIVHAGEDDFTTQPTGASGGRIACGVIE